MPNSYTFFKREIRQWFIDNIPPGTKILDVGPGQGTYADLLEGLGYEMHATEIYEPYIERYYLRAKYHKVYNQNIMHLLSQLGHFDFIILGDILEHLDKNSAQHLLHEIKQRQLGCLVAVPYLMEQDGEEYGNPHETHLQPDLTIENMQERYPDLELIYGNELYGYYKMKEYKHERAYILYCTESYAETTQACVDSIKAFSKIPIYVYMFGSDRKIDGATTIKWGEIDYNTKQNKYIDRKDENLYPIMMKRPSVVLDCLTNYAKTIAYVDSDSVATQFVDGIFDLYPYNEKHPYFVHGIYDWLTIDGKGGAESYDDLTKTLEHQACLLFNVDQRVRREYRQTGYFVAGQWSLDFIREWKRMCEHIDVRQFPTKYAPYHEETIANVLLWKKKIFTGLPYIYVNGSLKEMDVISEKGFTGDEQPITSWFHIPALEHRLMFYHGEKDPAVMRQMLERLKNKPMRVLFLAPHLSTGGMPAFLLKRIELLKQYTDIEVYVVEYQNYSDEYVVQKNKIQQLCNTFTLLDDKMKLMEIIKNNKIDVVHIDEIIEGFDNHNQVPEELMEALYASDRTWRIIETCHNVWFNPDQNKRYHPDAYAFCTPYHLETFKNMPSAKAVFEFPIEDLTETYSWQDAYMELGFDGSREHVVNIGLWTPGKNQKEAVELAKQLPHIDFHFVGNQAVNFKNYWEPIMQDLPPNCKVWGEREDTWKFLLACDAFMFNSTWECNPLVIREAISYGCKILARNLPQYVGMFDDYIVPIEEGNLKNQVASAVVGYRNYTIPVGEAERFALEHEELYRHVMDHSPQKQPLYVTQHFVGQPFLEFKGKSTSQYTVKMYDGYKLNYSNTLPANSWVRLNRKYFTPWRTEIWEDGDLVYNYDLEYSGKRVLITFNSSSLGDNIAWIPYALEFKKKHNCEVIVSTFKNELFESVYPELEFVKPGTQVEDLHGLYEIGWFYDEDKEPALPNTVKLQQAASGILGLQFQEIKPRLAHTVRNKYKGKYVTIATNSTSGCKFWTREAWQELINYLASKKYKVVNVSLEDNPFDNCEVPEDKSMQNTMDLIKQSKFFIGLSSGLSWLAWALDKPVVMIANFTDADHEFECIRVTNTNVCHGCWNKPEYKFDKGDWDWCPVHKGTDRHFECQRSITAEMVIEQIKKAGL